MVSNPALGVLFHWLGGLASASFYVPYRGVKGWAWETYWLVGGVFSWLIAPWFLAGLMTKDLFAVLSEAPEGLCFGLSALDSSGNWRPDVRLTMRYLGMSLGMAVVLGLCAAFGTLIRRSSRDIPHTSVRHASGRVIVIGIVVCLVGIAVAGLAGLAKERTVSLEQQRESIRNLA